jgi:hypothetical protein
MIFFIYELVIIINAICFSVQALGYSFTCAYWRYSLYIILHCIAPSLFLAAFRITATISVLLLERLLLNINAHGCWCSKTKLFVISSPNLPTPPPDYFHRGLVEDRMEAWRLSLHGFLKTRPVNLIM